MNRRAVSQDFGDPGGNLVGVVAHADNRVGAELGPPNRQDRDPIIIAGRDSAQDSINQIGQEMTRRNLNIQPTLTERPGLPVRIIVNRDLVLRPYQPLFFNRGTSR